MITAKFLVWKQSRCDYDILEVKDFDSHIDMCAYLKKKKWYVRIIEMVSKYSFGDEKGASVWFFEVLDL